ncbi:MAG: OmpP1/FadL family transporter [Burkholderiales bacterium]
MKNINKIMLLSVCSALAGISGGALASGFQLIEQNASGLGNAYAGQAAAAADASTIYFNPAGMTRLPGRNFVVAGHLIKPSTTFNNTATTPAVSTITGAGPFALNGNGGDGGDLAVIPGAYLSWQLNPRLFAGVGMSVPFGLKTDYDANWMGRFHAIKSEIKTINVNPSIAYKVNDTVSIGAGLNWQRVEAELTKAVNYSFVASAGGIPGVANNTEGSNKIEGSDSTWGFNLGVIINPAPDTNIGFSYRSAMNYKLTGDVSYFGRTALLNSVLGGAFGPAAAAAAGAQIGDSPVTADLKLPATFSAAFKHQINPKWEVLADATWTQWSTLKSLDIIRNSGVLLEATPFNWRDTWRVGVGVNYRTSDAWTVRAGVAYDQTPTSDTYRTPRLPDQDRTWLAFGAQYRLSKAGALDFGYAHLFVKDASIALSGPPALPSAAVAAGRGSLVGTSDNKVDIVSVQYRHSF